MEDRFRFHIEAIGICSVEKERGYILELERMKSVVDVCFWGMGIGIGRIGTGGGEIRRSVVEDIPGVYRFC